MAVDISLVIVRRSDGLVVAERWIGQSFTRDRMLDVLNDAAPVTSGEVVSYAATPDLVWFVAEERYVGGLTHKEVDAFAEKFPSHLFAWCLVQS